MLDRRRVHGGGFIGLLLGKTLPCVFLKSRCYPTTSPWARGYPMELAHPAQTEFVICDYAIENSLHSRVGCHVSGRYVPSPRAACPSQSRNAREKSPSI